jgi:hypothetical protein
VGELVRAEALLQTLVPVELPPCALKIRKLKFHSALYHGPRGITIDPNRDDIYGALMHELSHFLDHSLTGSGPFYASELAAEHFQARNFPSATRGSQALAGWWEAMDASQGVRKLRKRLTARAAIPLNPKERAVIRYLVNPAELFARSFCRWAAESTCDDDLLVSTRKEPLHVWWAPDDFAPIAAAFDALFDVDGEAIATLNCCAERRRARAHGAASVRRGSFATASAINTNPAQSL